MRRVNSWLQVLLALITAFSFFSSLSFAQTAGTWELLASSTIGRGTGKTRIALGDNVKRTLGIRLRVTRGTVSARRATVEYANGQKHFEDRAFTIAQQPTPAIDEREPAMGLMVVEAVEIDHASLSSDTRIEVWGLVPADRGGTRSSATPRSGTDYREVEVLFGTSRKKGDDRAKHGRVLATFGSEGAGLTRGRALVTIPNQGRPKGEIPRPTLDLILFRFDYRKENPKWDFTIAAVDIQPHDVFAKKVAAMARGGSTFAKQAFVFVHGYNTSFDDALFRAAQITHDIGFDGAPIVFSWQSHGGTLYYAHDQAAVREGASQLATLLREISTNAGVDRVQIVAHSMGSEVLIRALTDVMSDQEKPPSLKLGEVVFAAPDVDRKAFELDMQRLKSLATGITLYASAADKPLIYSAYKAGGRPRAGSVPQGEGPLVMAGVDTIDITHGSTAVFALNHSDFADREHLMADIHNLLRSSVRPPDARPGRLYSPIGQQPRVYWLYQRN